MRRGAAMIASGLALIVLLFVWYNRYQNPETLTPQAVDSILWLSQMFYVLLVALSWNDGMGNVHDSSRLG